MCSAPTWHTDSKSAALTELGRTTDFGSTRRSRGSEALTTTARCSVWRRAHGRTKQGGREDEVWRRAGGLMILESKDEECDNGNLEKNTIWKKNTVMDTSVVRARFALLVTRKSCRLARLALPCRRNKLQGERWNVFVVLSGVCSVDIVAWYESSLAPPAAIQIVKHYQYSCMNHPSSPSRCHTDRAWESYRWQCQLAMVGGDLELNQN